MVVCRCGHPGYFHEHYRPGTNCGAHSCSCPRFHVSLRTRAALVLTALAKKLDRDALPWR